MSPKRPPRSPRKRSGPVRYSGGSRSLAEEDRGEQLALFAEALPKTETHLHFEGALPFPLLQQVAPEYAGSARPPSWDFHYKFRDFAHFESDLLAMAQRWFTSVARYQYAARVLFGMLVRQNVKYVETSIASGCMEAFGLDTREVLCAIREVVPPELEVRLFLGIHHNGHTSKMRPVLEAALGWPELAGIDLHGAEDIPLETWTADYWEAARRAGKYTKAHAGEFMGPDFVRRVLHELRPQRIEHGIRAAEDPALLDELRTRGVALDVCPLSNHKLVPGVSILNHPIRHIFDAGVQVTLSSDDPIIFGNCVADEYVAIALARGFTLPQLATLARNGFEVALLSEAQRRAWIAEIDALEHSDRQ